MKRRLRKKLRHLVHQTHGSVCVEYLLLLTIVGIGAIVGLAAVRNALVAELTELADAVSTLVT